MEALQRLRKRMKIRTILAILAAGGLLSIFASTRTLGSEFRELVPPNLLMPAPFTPFPGQDLGNRTLDLRPPFRTHGRYILDAQGQRVKLASVNWYGASDERFIPGGLEVQHRSAIAQVIRDLGFNSVRLPYSDEMVMDNPMPDPEFLAANEDLIGLRALDVYIEVVEALTDAGLAVIINDHITQAVWCCGANLCDTAWYNDYLGPTCRVSQSEEQWMDNWVIMMSSFLENPLVIGADLRNEPRGLWGTMPWKKWAKAAQHAGNRLLKMNPNWLIFVEGVSSSNDLSDVRHHPVELDVAHRLVYSAHVYSWSGWGSMGGMYAKRPYLSFVESMQENWGYLLEDATAPVWVGEFGGPHEPSKGDYNYWKNLMKYLQMVDADFGYWALNPRKPHNDDNETYGLLEDDWQTPIFDYRMRDMQELMAE